MAQNARDTDIDTYTEHKIVCYNIKSQEQDQVIESDLINSGINYFNSVLQSNKEPSLISLPFILDIDLDCFTTQKSISPDNSSTIKLLASKASLITVATEPEYVKTCAIDSQITSEFLLEKLLNLLKS